MIQNKNLDLASMERALENCRLLAARERRREEKGLPPRPGMWDLILRFCREGGVAGSILRDSKES